MSEKYKTTETDKAYFVTFSIVNWVNVLEYPAFKEIIIDSLKFYQSNRGLIIYAYCVMPNHVHMIARSGNDEILSFILRDLKKYTAKAIARKAEDMKEDFYKTAVAIFENEGKKLKRISKYKVWQDGNRPLLLYSNKFIWQKLIYLHSNPVKAGLVENAEDYLFSSAGNYAGLKGILNVELLTPELKTIK